MSQKVTSRGVGGIWVSPTLQQLDHQVISGQTNSITAASD
jgi:hypothetical protein